MSLRKITDYFVARKQDEAPPKPAVRGRVSVSSGGGGSVGALTEPQAYISARVIRADGRVEDHGVIAKPEEQ